MKKINKICFLLAVLTFLSIRAKICEKKIFDENDELYQCSNCMLVSQTQDCLQNCQYYEQYQQQSEQYYSKQYNGCFLYCSEGKIAHQSYPFDSCANNYSLCIDGFKWDQNQNKCLKQLSCSLIIDNDLNLIQCLNCSFSSDINFCSICLSSQYYSEQNGCKYYCGNGLIADEQGSCSSSNICIYGFFWSIQDQKCKKCQNYFDENFGLFFCPQCNFISNQSYCGGYSHGIICQYMQYYTNQQCYFYCGNGLISVTEFDCPSSNTCIDGFKWSDDDKKCIKCDQILVDENFNLHQCQNCSLTSDLQFCNNSCLKQQYFSQKFGCVGYQGQGEVTIENQCVDGFLWNFQSKKCKKKCKQTLIDVNYDIQQCENCSLVSKQNMCTDSCQDSQYYLYRYSVCSYYCGNGLVAEDSAHCQSANICIDGYLWESSNKSCKKCNNSIFDTNFGLYVDSLCVIVSIQQPGYYGCKYSDYQFQNNFYQSSQCMKYCGDGLVSEKQQNCSQSTYCVQGFSYNDQTKKCENCNETLIDPQYNLYQCKGCGLTSNLQNCQCLKFQYFKQKFSQCLYYCGKGIIASQPKYCFLSRDCVDGFKYNIETFTCEKKKTCDESIFDQKLNLYKCQNCSLVSNLNDCKISQNNCSQNEYFDSTYGCRLYCENGIVTQSDNCRIDQYNFQCVNGFFFDRCVKKCLNDPFLAYFVDCRDCHGYVQDYNYCDFCFAGQYFSLQKFQCFFYCGKGRIALDKVSCEQSNTCMDKFLWNSSTQQCEKQCNSYFMIDQDLNLIQCENCSITSYGSNCSNPCNRSEYFSIIRNQCMVFCQKGGLISQDQASCATSNLCVDGFVWINSAQLCIKKQTCNQEIVDLSFNIQRCSNCLLVTNTQLCSNYCQNSQYFSQIYNKCMVMCSNGQIAETQGMCENSNQCVDRFEWNYQTKRCEQQNKCSYDTVDTNLQIYQCPNCSLVTNIQLCNNNCLFSQFYSQENQCMAYCGNGIIAKDRSGCQQSNICIDGFIYTELGKCNQYIQTESQNQSGEQNENNDSGQLIQYILIASVVILLILVIFLVYQAKKNKSIIKTKQFQQFEETTKIFFGETKEKIEQEMQVLNQKIETIQQIGIKQNEIIPTFNSKSKSQDLEEQPIEEQTLFKFAQNQNNQYDQISLQQVQSKPVEDYQENQ